MITRFTSSLASRNKLFNDWFYNDKNLKALSVLYERVIMYRQVL